ncbi:MAG: hypothetical protein L0Y50_01305 [Beijerinckiaceae bacterium]|nr:hypothetical protein [Beijerinckiaceae bacterium]MCI0734910.1 hypothetical protein [Beijerinckiaceae bacterium]
MGNFFGLDGQSIGDIRLNGIGWIGAILVVGATILAARLLVSWQVRRLEKLLAQKDADAAGGKQGLRGKRENREA